MLSAVFLIKRFAFIYTSIGTNPRNSVPVYSSFREIYLVNPQTFHPRFLSQDGIFYICIPVQVDYAIQNDFVENNIIDQADSIFKDQNRSEESIIQNGTSTNPRYVCKKDSSYTSENPQRSRATSNPINSINTTVKELNSNSKKNPTESHDPKIIENNKNLYTSNGFNANCPSNVSPHLNKDDLLVFSDTSDNYHSDEKQSNNEREITQQDKKAQRKGRSKDQTNISGTLIQIENYTQNNNKRIKLGYSSISHNRQYMLSEKEKSRSTSKTYNINCPDRNKNHICDSDGHYNRNYQRSNCERFPVISQFQESHQNSDNSSQNIPTEYQASSEPVNPLVSNPNHTIQSPGTDTNEPETLDENTNKVYRLNVNCMIIYSKIIDNVEILKNVNLSSDVDIKEFNLYDRLLCEDEVFYNKILNLEQKYQNSKKYDLYCFSFENFILDKTILEKFNAKYLEIEKEISNMLTDRIESIIDVISSLDEKFYIFFEKEFVGSVFGTLSPEHYWEFLKIFVDIARDPLFSVILPEFSTFDLKRNICYFKIVDNLDLFIILKFKLVLNCYNFLFHQINKIKNQFVKKRISIFVFNTRYFLRRYLICCLSSFWESNIRKLYMRITCHNIYKNFECIENIRITSKKHDIINENKKYEISDFSIDKKELLMRLFFQIDIINFRYTLGSHIRTPPTDDIYSGCFFIYYLLKDEMPLIVCEILKQCGDYCGIYKSYSLTLKIYEKKTKNSIFNVFLNPKFVKQLEFSDLQKVKDKQFGNDYSKNYIDDDLKDEYLNFNNNISKHQQILEYFDDQNIEDLADIKSL